MVGSVSSSATTSRPWFAITRSSARRWMRAWLPWTSSRPPRSSRCSPRSSWMAWRRLCTPTRSSGTQRCVPRPPSMSAFWFTSSGSRCRRCGCASTSLPGRTTSPEDVVAIHRSVQALSETIEDALFESRFKGLQELQLEEVDVTMLIRDVTEDVRYVAEAKGIVVHLESTEGPIALEADRRLLRSALSNLAYNAVKFSPDGSSVRLKASAPETGKVVFEVQDSCGGLPEGAVEKMFSPFVQLGKDRSGFGLGLALARQ